MLQNVPQLTIPQKKKKMIKNVWYKTSFLHGSDPGSNSSKSYPLDYACKWTSYQTKKKNSHQTQKPKLHIWKKH